MESVLDTSHLRDIVAVAYEWLQQHVFTLVALQQVLVICFIVLAARLAAQKLSYWLYSKGVNLKPGSMAFLMPRVYISSREVMMLLLLPVMMWMVVVLAEATQWPFSILNVTAILLTAWAVIRLSSSLIKSSFWSHTLALSIWVVTALSLLGWLLPAIEILDNAAIKIGGVRLSLLLILKSVIIFGLLLWLAGFLGDIFERLFGRSQTLTPSQKVLFGKLTRISLLALVIALGLNAVGIDLTALAVFSGALGIGIGFGLQKVFANLVSGFILLMDKSIKPGDVIAIGETYGWVNRLGARYVSILTRDGKEHLIPNESLITDRVENWSYSNDKVRIHIPVHVSYQSDIHQVKKLLLDVAKANPRILKSPEPTCLIEGFGDNSVNFEIRAWINDPINGIGNIRSSVYEAVWDVFKAHAIEIPFPQRDVHVKSIPSAWRPGK